VDVVVRTVSSASPARSVTMVMSEATVARDCIDRREAPEPLAALPRVVFFGAGSELIFWKKAQSGARRECSSLLANQQGNLQRVCGSVEKYSHRLVTSLPSVQCKLAVRAGCIIVRVQRRRVFPPSIHKLNPQRVSMPPFLAATEPRALYRTCLILHFHPFRFSYGQRPAKVAFLASTILGSRGSTFPSSPTSASIAATIAQPHSGACVTCSSAGLSPSSQPSSDLWQRKHSTLSGECEDGLKKKPARAS
jgi:hypothetical protein